MKLTVNEVAECLDVPMETVERWIRQGRIPIQRSGAGCFFHRSMLEVWASKHNLPFSLPDKDAEQKREVKPGGLAEAMAVGGVCKGIKGGEPAEILRSAVDRISFLDEPGREELYAKLLEREEMTSTGIGKGVAIPHPRTPLNDAMDKPVIVTCFPESPVEYRAVDDRPVFVLFILLSPSVQIHLHLLSRLAFCVRDESFLEFLKKAPDLDPLIERVGAIESGL